MSTHKNNRRILAVTLAIILGLAGILAWQLAPPRDPILGRWYVESQPSDLCTIHFHADKRFDFIFPGMPLRNGAWRYIPGPYVEQTPGRARPLIPAPASATDLPLNPAHARVRLYECRYDDHDSVYIALENGKLTSTSMDLRFNRPGNWYQRLWDSFR